MRSGSTQGLYLPPNAEGSEGMSRTRPFWISITSLLAVFYFEVPPLWDPDQDGINVKRFPGILRIFRNSQGTGT